MIHFTHPEALVLLVPALVVLWHRGFGRPLVAVARVLLVLGAALMLAGPEVRSGEEGRDLVVLVDRSRSVGDAAVERAREIARHIADHARPEDRLAMVGFARDAVLDAMLVEARLARFDVALHELDRDGTDLFAGIERALAVIPTNRPGSIAVISDGEFTGRSPTTAARAGIGRGIRIDAYPIRHDGVDHIAVESIETPGEVAVGEPFRVVAWVWSDVEREAGFRLGREGTVIAEGRRRFSRGVDRILVRDVLPAPGIAHYEVAIEVEGDGRTENNRASTPVRVVAAPRLLLLAPQGRRGRLAAAFEHAGLPIDVIAAAAAPISRDGLDPYSAVVLENVAAEELPHGALEVLSDFVTGEGGGLLMTGGERSFGLGGYRLSAVEDLLPVSMQVRQEQRRYALALAIALDRSGSMAMPVKSGQTKMDLANLGAVAAVEMLSTIDEVSVLAVDSSPHVIVPMGALADRSTAIEKIRSIESGGGGIFVGVAIEEMARQLEQATIRARHMILFADANDSEEPANAMEMVPKLKAVGVTLSVIAMGTEADQDSDLLKELARRGGGRCRFVADVNELPRVFAQETTETARSSFVDTPVGVDVRAGIVALGELRLPSFPDVGGYSIAWPRQQAQVALATHDDLKAPLLSTWQRGLGRAAAFLGEVDGKFTGALGDWPGFTDFFATLGRWLGGNQKRGALWAELDRVGHEGVLRVELGHEAEGQIDTLRAAVRAPDGVSALWLEQVDVGRFEAHFPLHGSGVHRAVVQLGDHDLVRTAPISLPYSPEFEPRPDPDGGERVLRELVAQCGGRIDPPLDGLFDGPRAPLGMESLGPYLAWAMLVLLLIEIAARRLELGPIRWRVRTAVAAGGRPASADVIRVPQPSSGAAPVASSAGLPATSSATVPSTTVPSTTAPPTTAPPTTPNTDFATMLDRARNRARRGKR